MKAYFPCVFHLVTDQTHNCVTILLQYTAYTYTLLEILTTGRTIDRDVIE